MKSAAHDDTRASVRTRYLGPTNYRGSRVVVEDDHPDDRRRIVIDWDDALNPRDNMAKAVRLFLAKFIPGADILGPGLSFGGATYWTWRGK